MRPDAEVVVVRHGPVPVAQVVGEVDMANAVAIGRSLLETVSQEVPGLVIDLSSTAYLDSAGLQMLMELSDRLTMRQQWLRLVAPDDAIIRRVLALTHLDSAIPVTRSLEEAL